MDTKTMIPEVYSRQRDIQSLNKLLDIVFTYCKYNIDNLGNIYDAYKCPENLLPFFARTLNYNYNHNDTVMSNRRTIDCFTIMEQHRGSEVGLKMATALSLTSMSVSQDNNELLDVISDYISILNSIRIVINYEEGVIQIDYPNVYTLVRYLLDYVRPVGMAIDLRAVVSTDIRREALLVYATLLNATTPYDPNIKTKYSKSYINFSAFADDNWLQQFTDSDSDEVNVDFNN
jgi:hypothetical protein